MLELIACEDGVLSSWMEYILPVTNHYPLQCPQQVDYLGLEIME